MSLVKKERYSVAGTGKVANRKIVEMKKNNK